MADTNQKSKKDQVVRVEGVPDGVIVSPLDDRLYLGISPTNIRRKGSPPKGGSGLRPLSRDRHSAKGEPQSDNGRQEATSGSDSE